MNPFLKWSALSVLIIANGMTAPTYAQVSPLASVPPAKDALSEPGLDYRSTNPVRNLGLQKWKQSDCRRNQGNGRLAELN